MVKAKNILGEVSSTSQVTVLTKPKFVKPACLSSSSAPALTTDFDFNDIVIPKLCVNEKSQLKLECQVNGTPKPIVKWFQDDDELKNNDKYKLESKQDLSYLNIKDVSLREKGYYKVVAENSIGTAVCRILIDINSIPVFLKGLSNTEIVFEENQKLELVCNYQSKPKAEPTWFFADKPIANEPRYSIGEETVIDSNGLDVYITRLTVQGISLKDSGVFKCKVKNCAGEVVTSGTLSVLKAPEISQKLPEFLSLIEKKEVKLECQIADAIPKATVTWHKDGNVINSSKRVVVSKPAIDSNTNCSIYTLTITETNSSDSGSYTIKAANKVATVESVCVIGILSAPKIVKDLKPSLQCIEGDKLQFDVTATGKPEPKFKWHQFDRNNNIEIEVLPIEESIVISKNENVYSLILNRVSKEMSGKYTLKLSNDAGSVETSCDLTVNCKL